MSQIAFYIAAATAVICSLMVITRHHAVHALLYLVISLLALSITFYLLGAPFAAALEVIIYAGAIMVLFIFVIMMLHLGKPSVELEKKWLKPSMWVLPGILSLILLAEIAYLALQHTETAPGTVVPAKSVAMSLYGPYVIGVELCAILLLVGIVGAYHLGKYQKTVLHRFLQKERSE